MKGTKLILSEVEIEYCDHCGKENNTRNLNLYELIDDLLCRKTQYFELDVCSDCYDSFIYENQDLGTLVFERLVLFRKECQD
jgi:hypothetical protein